MKKFYLFTKSLLVAAVLLVGAGNAWGDNVLYSQDYQSATDASSWTSSDSGNTPVSLQTASTNKFIRVGTSANGRYAYTNFFENNTSATSTFYKSYTSYTLSFDALLLGSTRQPSELVVMANGHSMPGAVGKRYLMVNKNNYDEGTNKYLLFLQSTDVGDNGSTDAAVYQKFYINQTSTTVTLPKDAWCTYTLNVTPTKVYYTIINKSTSATLQSGEYDIPDGQSNLAQGIFTFLHKQGTSGSGSGGQGGCLDIDNISIRIEPISATLDHTAGASAGKLSSENISITLDGELNKFNNDNNGYYPGYAFAKFSYEIPAGYKVVSAKLNYTYKNPASKNPEYKVYYLNEGQSVDFDNISTTYASNISGLRFDSNRTLAYNGPAGTKGADNNVTNVDVTNAVKAMGSQNYIIFQWTEHANGAELYGKGSGAKKPTLVIETAPEVLVAIDDCKAHETSSAFATYIEGLYEAESLNTVADVYGAHTAWQIENASDNDITKVIFDAAVSDFTRWNNARNNFGEAYTGAPDTKYFDAWNNDPSDAKQKIYRLPAGTYMLKAATRASEDVTDKNNYKVWVYGGSADVSVLGNHIGSTGGTLENGWSWTILPFTLTAKADVEIGFYSCPPASRWAGCDDFHLYKVESVSGTITDAGWSSFASPYALDLSTISGGTVYYASAADGSTVTLSTTTATVPAGEGIMVKGTAGEDFTINVALSGTTISGNLLKGQTTTGTVTASPASGEGTYHYVFGYNTSDATEYGFYNLAADTEVPEGKAYLEIVKGSGGARSLTIVLADEILTGINEAEAATEAVQKEGKFVVDGKLVIFKKGMKFNANGARIY